jgi:hypothetical protein
MIHISPHDEYTSCTVDVERGNEGMIARGTLESHLLECPICLTDFSEGEICRQLPCDHFFHKTCIDQWFQVSILCPMCKRNIQGFLHGDEAELDALILRQQTSASFNENGDDNSPNENVATTAVAATISQDGSNSNRRNHNTERSTGNPMIELSYI